MSDVELAALAAFVHRETLAMDWVNKQRAIRGYSMAYDEDNSHTKASMSLEHELKSRNIEV